LKSEALKTIIPGLSKETSRIIGMRKAKQIKSQIMTDYIAYEGTGNQRGIDGDDNFALYETLVDDIRELGFDGFHAWESGVDNIASFDNKSLKSALANVGSYSPEDARIMYSRKDLQGQGRVLFEVAPSPEKQSTCWSVEQHAEGR
jgi:hypothetical protein